VLPELALVAVLVIERERPDVVVGRDLQQVRAGGGARPGDHVPAPGPREPVTFGITRAQPMPVQEIH